jgi:transposase-like protein
VKNKGKWTYLDREVDKQERTVGFLLRPKRDVAVAKAFTVERSRARVDCRGRSRWTAIKLRIERRVDSSTSIEVAREPQFGPLNIWITSLSRITD